MHKNNSGFGAIGILFIILVVGFAGFAGWRVWQPSTKAKQSDIYLGKLSATIDARADDNFINDFTLNLKLLDIVEGCGTTVFHSISDNSIYDKNGVLNISLYATNQNQTENINSDAVSSCMAIPQPIDHNISINKKWITEGGVKTIKVNNTKIVLKIDSQSKEITLNGKKSWGNGAGAHYLYPDRVGIMRAFNYSNCSTVDSAYLTKYAESQGIKLASTIYPSLGNELGLDKQYASFNVIIDNNSMPLFNSYTQKMKQLNSNNVSPDPCLIIIQKPYLDAEPKAELPKVQIAPSNQRLEQ